MSEIRLPFKSHELKVNEVDIDSLVKLANVLGLAGNRVTETEVVKEETLVVKLKYNKRLNEEETEG